MEWNRILQKKLKKLHIYAWLRDMFAEYWAKELIAIGVLFHSYLLLHIVGCVFFTQQWKTFLQNDKMAWRRCSKICIHMHERATNISNIDRGKREERVRERRVTENKYRDNKSYKILNTIACARTSHIANYSLEFQHSLLLLLWQTHSERASAQRASIWYYGISNIFTFIMRLFPIHTPAIFSLYIHFLFAIHPPICVTVARSHFHSFPRNFILGIFFARIFSCHIIATAFFTRAAHAKCWAG